MKGTIIMTSEELKSTTLISLENLETYTDNIKAVIPEIEQGDNITIVPDATKSNKLKISASNVVSTNTQTLTDEQKSTARINIGAGTSSVEIGTTTGTAFDGGTGNSHITNDNLHLTADEKTNVGNLDNAAYKDVDTEISANSESVKLPTSKAVASFVEGKGYKTKDTTYTLTQDETNKSKITLTPSEGEAMTITLPSGNGNVTNDYDANGTDPVSGRAVASALATLPDPMVFKGSLGTDGTISTLPTASASNEGFTYKVITDGTYASQEAKIGDTFISDGTSWVLIPSGDEPSGTVTSVGVSVPTGLSVSNSPITSSGTIDISLTDGYSIPTTANQENWDSAYTHSTTDHAPSDAQVNTLEKIKVNNVEQSITNKTVNITVPTGAAASKDVDTEVAANSTSTNLPTTKAVADAISGLQSNFQDGVDGIYNAIVAQGTTPTSKSQSDVQTAIGTLSTNRYNAGNTAGLATNKTEYEPKSVSVTNAGAVSVKNAAGTSKYTTTIENSYDAGKADGISDTMVGTAVAANVLETKTFTNSSGVGITGTMTDNGAIKASVEYGMSYPIPEGFHNGLGYVENSITTGTIKASDRVDLESTGIGYYPDIEKYKLTHSIALYPPIVTKEGYVSESAGHKIGAPAGFSCELNKVKIKSTNSGTTKVTPVISKVAKPSDDTWTDAAGGNATTTKPTSGAYIEVQSAENTGTLTSTPSVTTPGYGSLISGGYDPTDAQSTVGANASDATYVPIKGGSATTPTASAASTSTSLSGTTLTVARSVTPTVSEGWVSSGTAGTVTITGTVPTQTKSATPSTSSQTISPDSGKLLSSVTVNAMPNGSLNNAATTGVTYTESTANTTIIPAEGALYINAGYIPNTKITLGHMIPDDANYTNAGTGHIRSGYEAYDTNGKKLIGTIADVTPSFTGGAASLTGTSNAISTNMTTATSGDYYIDATAKAKATRTAVTYNGAATGYINVASGTSASAANTSSEGSISATRVYIPTASTSKSNGTATATASAGTVTVVENPTASASVSITDNIGTTTKPTGTAGTDYWTIAASALSSSGSLSATGGSARALIGASSVTVGAGYNPSSVTASTTASDTGTKTGENVATTNTVASDSATRYITKSTTSKTNGTASATATAGTASITKAASASASATITSSIGTTTKPSGTEGTDYWTLSASSSAGSGVATATGGSASAKVTASSVSIGAGYNPSAVSASTTASDTGTKTGNTATTTESTKSASATRYITKSSSSKTDGTASATANAGTASITTNPSASASLTRTGDIGTTTKPTSGTAGTDYWVFTSSASANSGVVTATGGSASASVTASTVSLGAGYNPSAVSASTSAASTGTKTGNTATTTAKTASDSSSVYLTKAAGSVTMTAGSGSVTGSNVTLSDTNNGISVTGKGAVSATAKITTAGYTPTNNSFATGSSTNSNSATKYITAVTVPKDVAFSVSTTADTALDSTSNLSITNNAYRQIALTNNAYGDVNITNKGQNDYTAGGATAGNLTVNAYNNASTPALTGAKTIVSAGKWSRTSLNATSTGGTYYGAIDFTKPTQKAAATYNTSTSDQTISASQYLTGAQTIKAVTTSNIDAANIKKDVVVKVGDANSAGRIKNVTGTLDYLKTVTSVPTTKDTSVIYNSTDKTYYVWRD